MLMIKPSPIKVQESLLLTSIHL